MDSTPVYLQEEYSKTEIAKILNLLDEELVGLAPVKTRIREIAAMAAHPRFRGTTAGSGVFRDGGRMAGAVRSVIARYRRHHHRHLQCRKGGAETDRHLCFSP